MIQPARIQWKYVSLLLITTARAHLNGILRRWNSAMPFRKRRKAIYHDWIKLFSRLTNSPLHEHPRKLSLIKCFISTFK